MAEAIIWTEDMLAALHTMRGLGKPITECAERVGVSYETTLVKCRALGLAGRMSRGRTRADAVLQARAEVAGVIAEARNKRDLDGFPAADVLILDDAKVTQEQGGCWVEARVWVENVYVA